LSPQYLAAQHRDADELDELVDDDEELLLTLELDDDDDDVGWQVSSALG
jgi:hypothetical protein